MDALTRFTAEGAHLAGQIYFFGFSKISRYEFDYPLFFKFMATHGLILSSIWWRLPKRLQPSLERSAFVETFSTGLAWL
ncbi:MAG TPA: hypothetical protein DIT67_01810 [Octadecabacter sp.]|nr:hypothetical protein [Octadecabacter sp.]